MRPYIILFSDDIAYGSLTKLWKRHALKKSTENIVNLYVQDSNSATLYVQDTILYVQDSISATLYVQDSNSVRTR